MCETNPDKPHNKWQAERRGRIHSGYAKARRDCNHSLKYAKKKLIHIPGPITCSLLPGAENREGSEAVPESNDRDSCRPSESEWPGPDRNRGRDVSASGSDSVS